MGFRLDSNFDGIFMFIFCYEFLFFGFGWLDFGFRLDFGISMGLGWAGGHGGGVVVTMVGHVWSSWVNMVGLFSCHWLLW